MDGSEAKSKLIENLKVAFRNIAQWYQRFFTVPSDYFACISEDITSPKRLSHARDSSTVLLQCLERASARKCNVALIEEPSFVTQCNDSEGESFCGVDGGDNGGSHHIIGYCTLAGVHVLKNSIDNGIHLDLLVFQCILDSVDDVFLHLRRR